MTFRWQTDDDADQPLADQPPPDWRFQRRALSILALLALISFAGFLTWRTVRQRAAETEERLKADVLSIHNLVRSAAEAGDEELYLSFLPRDLEGWAATQQQLLQDELLFSGAARAYDLVPLPGAARAPEVRLDPSLSQATVLSEQSFAYTTTASLNEAVTLRLAQTYSLGDTGWQVAPPPPDFWTGQVTLLGERITLQYPQRDETVALRLLPRLEALLSQMCALPGLDCPADFHLTLRLVPDPATLAHAEAPEALLHGVPLRDDTRLDLPAPSLVGQPIDDNGEALVVRAYAARTLAPLISHLSGYECCSRGLFARAILERQLYHLGLRSWPLAADQYEVLMEEGLTLGDALILQARDATPPLPGAWRQVLSLVEFLEASLPPGELLFYMDATLDYWLLRAEEPGDFVVRWTEFVYDRSRSAQMADDLNRLPRGAIQLTCFESGAVAVQRYDLQGAGWRHGLTHTTQDGWQIEVVFPLPADYGDVIKVVRRDAAGERVARFVWRHSGGATVLFETMPEPGGAPLFAPYDGSAPHWRYTVLSPDHVTLRASVEQEWWHIQMTVCEGGACQPQQTVARPRWSPDGSQLLLEARPEGGNRASGPTYRLYRSGNRGQNAIEIGRGYAVAWLGAAHYAFVRPAATRSGQELLVAATRDDRPHVVAVNDDFVALLDKDLPGGQALQLERLQAHPTDPQSMFVQVTRPPVASDIHPDSFLFAAHLSPNMQHVEELELLFHSDGGLDFRPSPNGRWVAAANTSTTSNWTLIDLQYEHTFALGSAGAPPPVWSPDGNWLAQQSRYSHIMLHAPTLDYKRPIVHELSDCTFSSLHWHSR